jgi:ferredoxin-type protein NapH
MRWVMIWLLPVVVIGGFFYPHLGYLVVAMIAVMLVLSYFHKRYWCTHLCPRGSLLDLALARLSRGRRVPRLFTNWKFRWAVFFAFMAFLTWRIVRSGGTLLGVGSVFVTMCLITTVISVILGIQTRRRAWCAICPMGTLQEKIWALSHRRRGRRMEAEKD